MEFPSKEKRIVPVLTLLILMTLPAASFASKIEKEVQDRWIGSWVVTRGETYSDCERRETANLVRGDLVKSGGRHRFAPGELARVERVEMKRGRVELSLTLSERFLLERREGRFQLYRAAVCGVKLVAEMPRAPRGVLDAGGVDGVLEKVVDRFASEAEAQGSETWNRRRMEPFPEDYEMTLVRHAVWKAERINSAAQARFDQVLERTTTLIDRMRNNTDYQAGFSEGVRAGRSVGFGSCAEMLKFDLDRRLDKVEKEFRKKGGNRKAAAREGFRDGHLMALGMKLLRRLPDCFVPISEAVTAHSGGSGPAGSN